MVGDRLFKVVGARNVTLAIISTRIDERDTLVIE